MDTSLSRTHLSIREVAARWGVSPNFIRRLIWDGKLASTRFGRTIRIPVSVVDDYADRNTRPADQAMGTGRPSKRGSQTS